MKHVVLTRIDDRLIHGQVMTAWVKYTRCNEIVIIDDNVSKDDFLKMIMKEAAPSEVNICIYNVEEAIEYLNINDNSKRVVILAKNPFTVYELIERNIKIGEVIIGGISAKRNRTKLYRNISASMEEREVLNKIIHRGLAVKIRIIPDDKPIDIYKYLLEK